MIHRLFLAICVVVLALLILLRVLDPVLVQGARNSYFDVLQRFSPREAQPLPVRVVDIDEASLAEIGQWPWPRDVHADLVARLWDLGAAVIVFDVLFSEPDRMSPERIIAELEKRGAVVEGTALDGVRALDNDEVFAGSMIGRSVVLGAALVPGEGRVITPKSGFVEIGDRPSTGLAGAAATTPILTPLADAAQGIGMVSVSPLGESDTIRSVPLVWASENGAIPSLAVEALRVAYGVSTIVLGGVDGAPGLSVSLTIGDHTIPTTPDGQIFVRYRKDDRGLYVSARDVLSGELPQEAADGLNGSIVFVGTSAAGLLDIRQTPLGENVPGVSIHAQIVEQILTNSYLVRNGIIGLAEVAVLWLIGVVLVMSFAFAGPLVSVACGAISSVGVLGASWILFDRSGLLFDATFPMGAGLVMFAIMAAYQFIVADREKRQIRRSFSHYVSGDVLDEIESRGYKLQLGGMSRAATVMFCDIRNFTPMSEGMDPGDLVALLNRLFTSLGREILQQRGTIDKFIGDAVMAFWNAPVDQNDHSRRALTAALGMRRALAEVNRDFQGPQVSLAIGLASGTVLVGNIGSKDRFNYSVVGNTVNLASRIETACRHVDYDILTTAETAEAASDLATLPAGRLELKGLSDLQPTSIVVGDGGLRRSAAFQALAERHVSLMEALATSGPDTEALLEECTDLGRSLEPGLERFYARLRLRAEDFASP